MLTLGHAPMLTLGHAPMLTLGHALMLTWAMPLREGGGAWSHSPGWFRREGEGPGHTHLAGLGERGRGLVTLTWLG